MYPFTRFPSRFIISAFCYLISPSVLDEWISAEYEVLIQHYSQIVDSFHAKPLSPYFVARNVISLEDQQEIFSLASSKKAASYLLSRVHPSLRAGINQTFYVFLDITDQYGSAECKTISMVMRRKLLEMTSKMDSDAKCGKSNITHPVT